MIWSPLLLAAALLIGVAGPAPVAARMRSESAVSGVLPLEVGPDPTSVEYRVSPSFNGRAWPRNSAYEPTVTTHPTDPNTLAVVYQGYESWMHCGFGSVVRISHDGGATWRSTKVGPGLGGGRGQSYHATIAWGPGPTEGSARLYWVNTTVPGCNYKKHSVTMAWSDDEGVTWSKPVINSSTAPWIGGLPAITVDRNPVSPGFGNVFVIYNHALGESGGSGMRVLASTDYGGTWSRGAEVPPAPLSEGCRYTWRISYRGAVGADGILHVVGYQSDLRRWSPTSPFAKGGSANVCRQAFITAAVTVDRVGGTINVGPTVVATEVSRSPQTLAGIFYPGTNALIADPTWAYGLSVDPTSGAIYLAVGDVRTVRSQPPAALVRLGTSLDGGLTWSWQDLPAIRVAGARSTGGGASGSFRPVVTACGDGRVVVGLRTATALTAKELRATRRPPVVIGGYAFVSRDAGATWAPPLVTARASWNARVLGRNHNGIGLADSAACTANGLTVLAYGDGRDGATSGRGWGRTSVLLSVVDPGVSQP
jgi:hypothetical protein